MHSRASEAAIRRPWPLLPLGLLLLLGGCVPYQPPPQPTPPPAPPPQPAPAPIPLQPSAETLQALSQLTDLKEELKRLRNAVEELQFDSETAKRRQMNLYQDLDRRLLGLESAQRLLLLQPPATTSGGGGGASTGSTPDVPIDVDATGAVDAALVGDGDAGTGEGQTPPDDSTTTESVSLAEQNAYDQAFDLLKQSKYQDAIDQFQQLADTWPDGGLSDDAHYWMAEARYVNREFEAALSGFRTVVTRYPNSERAPEALLKIGYIQYDIGTYEEAAETFRDILEQYPGHEVAVSAQTRLRRIEQTIQYDQ